MSASKILGAQKKRRILLWNIHFWRAFFYLMIGTAWVFTGFSVALFVNHESNQAWLLHGIGLVLFCVAFVGTGPALSSISPSPSFTWLLRLRLSRTDVFTIGAFVATCVLAGWLRLHQLDRFPANVFFDEADNANHALRIVRDTDFRPVYVFFTNLPAHFLYVMAWMFEHYGADPIAMRYTAVVFGVATVALTFLLFRRWFGWVIAFIGAFFLAVMREHLTFSRLAMHGITVPFFVVLVLYLLDRALAHKRLFDWAMLGIALGLSLCFYTPLRILPPLILGYLFVLGLLTIARRRIKFKQLIAPVIIMLIGCVIAVAPFAQYALRKPEIVFSRTDEVSLLNADKRLEKNLPLALWYQANQHFLMFNIRGDNNGRHNLPGAPLLDPIMGTLFVAGLVLALAQIARGQSHRHRNTLMLLMLITMNLPGILSLEIEAPHALRSIGTLPAALYFACLPLAWLTQYTNRIRWPIKAAAIGVLCAVVGLYNYNWFFNIQANDPQVWAAYSPAESIVAREANRQMADSDIILSDKFRYQPIAEFLIQDLSRVQSWNGTTMLEIPSDRERAITIIVEPDLVQKLQVLQRTCPHAMLQPIPSPIDQSALAYELHIPQQC